MLRQGNIQDILYLTPLQEGILYHYQRNPQSIEYHQQLSLKVNGEIDLDAFQNAWEHVIGSNECLRTLFKWRKLNRPVQVVLQSCDLNFSLIDISDKDESVQLNLVQEYRSMDKNKKFTLDKEPPFRILLIKSSNTNYEILISFHHIIFDGWSLGIILNEFLDSYDHGVSGLILNNIKKGSYKEYIKYINEYNEDHNIADFWLDYLQGVSPEYLSIRNDNTPKKMQYNNLEFSSESFLNIKRYLKENKVTLASFIYSIWGILLHKYQNKNDVVFGTTVSGRNATIRYLENTAGLFINTVPCKVAVHSGQTVKELIVKTNMELINRSLYENTSLVNIKNYLDLKGGEQLFDSLVVIENYPLDNLLNNSGHHLNIESFSMEEATNYNLVISAYLIDDLTITFSYNEAVFPTTKINWFIKKFNSLVEQIIKNPNISLSELSFLSSAEQKQILEEFNDTQVDYPKNLTIQVLFEEQVEKTPDAIAVVFGDKQLTYRELNESSNQLARLLIKKGVQSETLVGVMVGRSIEMVVGILAILKAGGAYVPINHEYPEERIKYMIEDSKARVLLTTRKSLQNRELPIGEILYLEDEELYGNEAEEIAISSNLNSLTYVIYTSGTTGKPKGVMLEQKGVINLTNWFRQGLGIKGNENILQFASIAFDAFSWELFMTLLLGNTLYIPEKDIILSPDLLNDYIRSNQITTVTLPPFIAAGLESDSGLKRVIVAGSEVKMGQIKHLVDKVEVINAYGPTEDTICTTYYKLLDTTKTVIPIGKPIANHHVLIMDHHNKLQPIGVAGELCISGVGLARGYLNNEELTSERFIEHPYKKGEILYKTGDLARWLPNGNIEYLGRMDHQLKIRGFRIELGEIDNRLLSHALVCDTVVISSNDASGEKFLCAYIVASEDVSISELRAHLAKTLPEYMIPSYFILLDALPLNSNGKVDRKALPEPEGYVVSEVAYVAPQTATQHMLVEIWQEVLGLEQPIGIHDNFFELGGHSLRVTSFIAKVHRMLDVEVPHQLIFQCPTIEELSSFIDKAQKQTYASIEVVEKQPYYPVSAAQKRMYILNQLDKQSTSYNIATVLTLEGSLDFERLENVLIQLVERHEAFRTEIILQDHIPYQRVLDSVPFSLQILERTEAPIEEQIQSFIQPFDLQQAPLLKVGLLQESEDKHILIIDMHHIISDAHSISLLMEEFSTLYAGGTLPDLRIQYKDYALWQEYQLINDEMKEHREYWLKQFESGIPILDLPTDYPRPAVQSFEGDRIRFSLSPEITVGLREIANKHNVTMFMLLFAAYNTLLYKYTGQEEIVVGAPIAGRTHANMEKIVGVFANTLALKTNPRGDMAFSEFLAQVRNQTLEAFQHQDYQFDELVNQLDVERDMSRHPLFDTLFNFVAIESLVLNMRDLTVMPYGYDRPIAKFDLSLEITETNNGLRGEIEFSQKLFRRETIERWKTHFTEILRQLSMNGEDKRIADIVVLPKWEQKQILEEFNDTQVDYRTDITIHALFEEQVEKSPNKVAVVVGHQEMTYKELNERANQLAHTLRDNGVKPDGVVAIMVERSFEMIISIMGVLKAGAAYLPVDPELPIERINYMLKNSQTEVLVSQLATPEELTFEGVCLNLEKENALSRKRENPVHVNKARDLAYVIYTSGSTGMPKGVMIEHQSVVNMFISMLTNLKFNEEDTILSLTTISFDIFVLETIFPITNGMKVVIGKEKQDEVFLKEFIRSSNINTLQLTPSRFRSLMKFQGFTELLQEIDTLLIGGEAISRDLVEIIMRHTKNDVYNVYGPTETTIWSTVKVLSHGDELSIGKPINNTRIYICDSDNNLQPIGIPGELCIAGDGLARGYFGNPTLTAEKFEENPFAPGKLMYKTGDLARWLPDGNIEFLGRIDHQVKIRGFRIELGEIENTLLTHPFVEDAVVISSKDVSGDDFLCAYIVVSQYISVSELRSHLGKTLPDYMIPSYCVPLDDLPLNANGKVDRKALPEPKGYLASEVPYVAPQTSTQHTLVEIWQEILGVEQPIGILDNFFELGGHSLQATSFMAKVHQMLEIEVPLRLIFQYPTIEEIASYIDKAQKQTFASIEVVEKKPYYPVSAAQKRVYISYQLDKQSTSYNMPVVLTLEGRLDLARLENAFIQLVERHEAFRTEFNLKDGVPVQRIVDSVPFSVQLLERTEESIEEQIQSLIHPFDLQQAPLLRVGLLRESEEKHILLIDMHHIISDGQSLMLITEEISTLYAGGELPELRIQYKDYAVWQQSQLQSDEMKEHKKYWLKQFESSIPVLELPTDYPRPAVQSFEGESISFTLSPEVTASLREITKKYSVTMYMLLFAAYNTLLYKYTGQEEIVVGTPIAGRTHADMKKIVGIFVNSLAIKTNPWGDMAFSEFLAQVKNQTLEAYQHQDYQFEELVEQLDLERDVSRQPLFDTWFNLEVFDKLSDDKSLLSHMKIGTYNLNKINSKFDLSMLIEDYTKIMKINLVYSTSLFKRETIYQIQDQFLRLLDTIITEIKTEIRNIELLSDEEMTDINKILSKRRKALSVDLSF